MAADFRPDVPAPDDDPLTAASGRSRPPRVPGAFEPDFDSLELLSFLNHIGVMGQHREYPEPLRGSRNGVVHAGYVGRVCPRCRSPFIIGKGRFDRADQVCGGHSCRP